MLTIRSEPFIFVTPPQLIFPYITYMVKFQDSYLTKVKIFNNVL